MYKLFKNIGLIMLVIASFMYSEKVAKVVKEYDDIMIDIRNNENKVEVKEAVIDKDTIIPGINGKVIDIDKSYTRMRQYGKYNPDLLIYKIIKPKDKLKDNKDKYIIKGSKANQVALIVILNDNDDINNLLKSNIKFSFYITNSWLQNHKNKINELVNNKYTILSNDNDYIKKIAGQKNGYCYLEEKDLNQKKECFENDDYIIKPSIIVKDRSLLKLEENIESGSIISIKPNNYEMIVKYILNKGYDIVSIEQLLNENI